MIRFNDVTAFGYSQFVEVDLGAARMVVIAGQVPMDDQGNTIGAGDFSAQAHAVYRNVMNYVAKAGGKASDIIKLNVYVTDVSYLPELRKIRDQYINTANPPASTTVAVSSLFRKEVMIEIETTLMIKQ